jgi:MFS family permease
MQINYYAPDIFKSIGITGASTSLLASGIYGIVKIVATSIFIFFGIERFGRRWSLVIGLALMSMFLWIIGAIFNTNRGCTATPALCRVLMTQRPTRRPPTLPRPRSPWLP